MEAVQAAPVPLQVRGRFFTGIVIRVAGAPDEAFHDALDARIAQSPRFFDNAPIVLDIEHALGLEDADALRALAEGLRARGLTPIGVQNTTNAQGAAAAGAGLLTLPGGRDEPRQPGPRPVPSPKREPAAAKKAPEPAPEPEPAASPEPAVLLPATRIVTEPVRSGQCVVAERGDLVVVASVSSGAELIARGNIHVYGTLRGRALAGVHGDTSARIFCQSLEAELIAIAGLYKTNEAFSDAAPKQRVQAFLRDDTLCIEALR